LVDPRGRFIGYLQTYAKEAAFVRAMKERIEQSKAEADDL
jgi:hypothetical protein